jgi:mRNA-degrading endonuclease RelE of RelBE toxin-antitoxin system
MIVLSEKAEKQLRVAPESVQNAVFRKYLALVVLGKQIPRKQLPQTYRKSALFRVKLPTGWRLLFSVEQKELIIFEVLCHKDYSRLLKY